MTPTGFEGMVDIPMVAPPALPRIIHDGIEEGTGAVRLPPVDQVICPLRVEFRTLVDMDLIPSLDVSGSLVAVTGLPLGDVAERPTLILRLRVEADGEEWFLLLTLDTRPLHDHPQVVLGP
jgi:hypothetical protein